MLCACGRIGFDPRTDAGDDVSDPSLAIYAPFDGSDVLPISMFPADCTQCPTQVPGHIGDAAQFDGTQCVFVRASDLQPAQFTFALCANTASAVSQTAFGRPFNGATLSTNTIETFLSGGTSWRVGVNTMFVIGVNTALGEWHHIAGVFDGTTLFRYLDGVGEGSIVAGAAMYALDDFTLGCDFNMGAPRDFTMGLIDDVRFYTRVLSPQEIADLAAM